jgi:hypothetical protein
VKKLFLKALLIAVACIPATLVTLELPTLYEPDSRIVLVHNYTLKPHEQVDEAHVQELATIMTLNGYVPHPVTVDRNTRVILDGHHRVKALEKLGLLLVPVYFVDYTSDEITVEPWREGEVVTKETVIQAGLTGNLLPIKSSKNYIPNKPTNVYVPLELLK